MNLLKEWKRAFKVPLVFHWSLLILLALFIYSYNILYGFLYFSVIVSSVLFHEYAHVWIAQRSGAHVDKVIVMALGAAAMIETKAFLGKFNREFKCAIAGPAASLVLFLIFLIPFTLIGLNHGTISFIIAYSCLINLLMCVFNLLPIYPMDGGRILNAILGSKFSKKRGIVRGGILGIKVSSVIGFILSTFGVVISFYYGWIIMGITFSILFVFGYVNRVGMIDMYNKM